MTLTLATKKIQIYVRLHDNQIWALVRITSLFLIFFLCVSLIGPYQNVEPAAFGRLAKKRPIETKKDPFTDSCGYVARHYVCRMKRKEKRLSIDGVVVATVA